MRNTAAAASFLPERSWMHIVESLGLSAREAQIAYLLLRDDNREDTIAAALAISPHTVHTHLERLYRKLGVSSRSQVVVRLFQQYVELAPSQPRQSTPSWSFVQESTRRARVAASLAHGAPARPKADL